LCVDGRKKGRHLKGGGRKRERLGSGKRGVMRREGKEGEKEGA
jgi:hypothetical protein